VSTLITFSPTKLQLVSNKLKAITEIILIILITRCKVYMLG
jgi:hypothetical protein